MHSFHIMTDSAADLPLPPPPGVTVLPIRIRFGEEEYLDGVTLDHAEFYQKLTESQALPTTSLIAPVYFEEAYRDAEARGEKVLVITLSSRLSGTYQCACTAAVDYGDHVAVVDSLNATVGQQILILYALRLREQGCSLEETVSLLEQARTRVHVLARLDTLEYLQKGGRISKSVAWVGSLMAIKPVVAVCDGEVVLVGKARGSRNSANLLNEEIAKAHGIDFSMPYLLGYSGTDPNHLQKYIEDSRSLWEAHTDSLPIRSVGATVGTHVGPGGIVVAFFERDR